MWRISKATGSTPRIPRLAVNNLFCSVLESGEFGVQRMLYSFFWWAAFSLFVSFKGYVSFYRSRISTLLLAKRITS